MFKSLDNSKKVIATVIMVGLIAFLIFALLPYKNAFFGALILFVLVKPLHEYLSKHMSKRVAATITIIVSILVLIIPLFILAAELVTQVNSMIKTAPGFVESLDLSRYGLDANSITEDLIVSPTNYLKNLVVSNIGKFTQGIITLMITYFLLFYLLVNCGSLKKIAFNIIPFSKKNANVLIDEFENITYSGIYVTGIIAVVQGFLIYLSFAILGLSNPIFWGFMGVILSIVPLLGPAIVWIPAAVILFLQDMIGAAIAMLVFGLILSNVDNLFRPYLQEKFGQTHPLIVLIGLFIGVTFFGMIGFIVGPLLLSYFFLLFKMYNEEYMK